MAADRALQSQLNLPQRVLGALVTHLEDQDWRVREAAVRAIGGQSSLPEWVLGAIVARLEDQVSDVRKAAVRALGDQFRLPEWVLGAIALRLLHHDWEVREAATEALGVQSNLPEKMFSKLIREDGIHREFLVGGNVRLIFTALLEMSLENHLAWYIQDGNSCLETQNGAQSVALHEEVSFWGVVEQTRKDFGIPAVSNR